MNGHSRGRARHAGVCLALGVLVTASAAGGTSGSRGALRFRGLEGEELRLHLDPGASRLEHALFIDETANARVDTAQLRVTGLRDESGAQVATLRATGPQGQPFLASSVEPSGSVPILLEAEIPAPGTYRATLTLIQDGTVQASARLIVTRPKPELNVRFEVLPARGYSQPLGSQGQATLQFTLYEREGWPVLLAPPVLARLVLKDDTTGDAGFQALAEANFLDPKGQPMQAPFLLDRWMTLPLRLELAGLPGPGRYEGTIRISSADAPALDIPFVLSIRERPIVAFVLIALGVALSFLVRRYVAHERPRMVLQQRVLRMAQVLEKLRTSEELPARGQDLIAAVAQEAGSALADLAGRSVGLGRVGVRIEFLERKVACTRNWLRLRRAVDEMRPMELRAEPEAKLEQVERSLRAPGVTAEELSDVEAALASLPTELDARMRKALAERLARLRTELEPMAQPPASPQAMQLELRVKQHLDKAEALLGRDLRAAFDEMDAARLAHTALLADRLSSSLEGPAPSYLGHDDWMALRAKAGLLLEPLHQFPSPPADTGVAAYEEGLALVLRTQGGALAAKARAILPRLGDPADAREGWQRVLDAAERLLQLVAERRWPEATRALEEARQAFEVGLGPGIVSFSSEEEPEEGAFQVGAQAPAWLFDGVRLFVPRLEGRPAADGLAQLEKRLVFVDLFILALVVGIAALGGMKLLWVGAPAWGSLTDHVVAFSWGFGLHQVFHPGLAGLLGSTARQERCSTETPGGHEPVGIRSADD